jgi:hypothetical protein
VTREEDLLYDICHILESTGDSLERDPGKTVILRRAQERVHELAAESNQEDLVFLDYFLKSFIRRLWDNLMIDFPYEVGEEASRIRRGILDLLVQNLGRTLMKLADSLRREDSVACYNAYREMANSYVHRTRELERARK